MMVLIVHVPHELAVALFNRASFSLILMAIISFLSYRFYTIGNDGSYGTKTRMILMGVHAFAIVMHVLFLKDMFMS